MNPSNLLLFWKILAISLFVSAISCVYFNNWALGYILGLCYNYVMFEVLTTYSEKNDK